MPKLGLSKSQWKARLTNFANGSFSFGRGQRPSKGSPWYNILVNIESCPVHNNVQRVNIFGQRIECNCGYHEVRNYLKICVICIIFKVAFKYSLVGVC